MLKEFLNESLTSTVFRCERLENFYRTITENKFYTSLAFDYRDSVKNKNYMYFLSTMRTKHNYFSQAALHVPSAIITLDGSKLNNNYKGTPVKYFQPAKDTESEDRVLTNKKYIENAISYIKHVDFLIPKICDFTTKQYDVLIEIINVLDKTNIQYYVYDERDYALTSNKKHAIAFRQFKDGLSDLKNRAYKKQEILEHAPETKNLSDKLNVFKLLVEEILEQKDNSKKIKNITDNTNKDNNLYFLTKNFKSKDYENISQTVAHISDEIYSKQKKPEYRDIIHDFFVFIKKYKANNLFELDQIIKFKLEEKF